ncbi:anti-sigma factor [Microbacter sp. GSS18]|nr:anti-sigma factor [Microbacter sp. GSS18]
MTESEFAELAAGHVLNALSDADERLFRAELEQHPEWAHHVEDAFTSVDVLAESVEPVAPPPAVRSALLERIAAEQREADAEATRDEDFAAAGPAPTDAVPVQAEQSVQTKQPVQAEQSVQAEQPVQAERSVPTEQPVQAEQSVPTEQPAPGGEHTTPRLRTRGRRGPRRLFVLAASIVAVLVLGFGTFVVTQQLVRPAAVVALERIDQAGDAQTATVELADGGQVTAHWSVSEGQAVLVADGLPVVADDETFELWFVRDGGAVSAGTFAAGTDGDATTLLAGTYEPGDVIAVTVEPEGGSPTGAPTSDPILAITT